MEDAEEWTGRKQTSAPQEMQIETQRAKIKWKPPPLNWLKCNTDGAWSRNNPHSGTGWILRNHEGKMLRMGAKGIPRTRQVIETELEALRWALRVITNFQYQQVIFESDSKELVTMINSDEEWPAHNPILQDIRNMLTGIQEAKVVFTYRGGNAVADKVAKESLSLMNYDPRMYSLPPLWIKPFMDAELV